MTRTGLYPGEAARENFEFGVYERDYSAKKPIALPCQPTVSKYSLPSHVPICILEYLEGSGVGQKWLMPLECLYELASQIFFRSCPNWNTFDRALENLK